MKITTKKLYFDGFANANPECVEAVSNDRADYDREREYIKAQGGSQSYRAIANEYFYVPPEFNPLGRTYRECLEAGCKQITRQEDL